VRNLALGESGDVSLTAQCKNSAGRWVAATRPQNATRWKARVYVRGHDGIRQEIVRFGRTRREAQASVDTAVAAVLRGADAVINPTMPLLEAGEYWQRIRTPETFLGVVSIGFGVEPPAHPEDFLSLKTPLD
jgi:ribonucleotide monophosphatase NagD (HAD superfamily)